MNFTFSIVGKFRENIKRLKIISSNLILNNLWIHSFRLVNIYGSYRMGVKHLSGNYRGKFICSLK